MFYTPWDVEVPWIQGYLAKAVLGAIGPRREVRPVPWARPWPVCDVTRSSCIKPNLGTRVTARHAVGAPKEPFFSTFSGTFSTFSGLV